MSIMEQLRQKQLAAGVKAPANPEEPVDAGIVPAPPSVPSYPTPASPPATIADSGFNERGGYIKIFPPTAQSIADLTPVWIEENWTKPSPWCSLEGLPDHPDFAANLRGVES